MAGSIGNSNVNGGGDRQEPSSSNRIRRKARVSVPMTAMIDVTFLLLIYFLLSTTFRQAEGQLPGTLPKAGPIIDIDDRELLAIPLQVRAMGANCESAVYSFGGSDAPLRSPQELADSLRARRERIGADAMVVIRAGRAVRWRYIVEACNQAARANFQTTIRIQG
jgi:biopolymer transport protein ExbD